MLLDTCVKCGRFGPGEYWEYAYGHRRRGVRLATLEPDSRTLGVERDFVCKHCDLFLLWLGLREFGKRHPLEALAMAAIAMALLGGLSIRLTYAGWSALAIILGGLAFTLFQWYRRKRKWMAKLVFELRKAELAVSHALKPSEIEHYPLRDSEKRSGSSEPAV